MPSSSVFLALAAVAVLAAALLFLIRHLLAGDAEKLIPMRLVPVAEDDPAVTKARASAVTTARPGPDSAAALNRKARRKQAREAPSGAMITQHARSTASNEILPQRLQHAAVEYLTLSPAPASAGGSTETTIVGVTQNEEQRVRAYLWHSAPSLLSAPTSGITLSVIVPAFNETARLPAMLDETVGYLTANLPSDAWEIIVVDDGSSDGTTACALAHATKAPQQQLTDRFAVVRLPRNCGKGAAVRAGILRARGEWALFADADGATRFADIEKLVDQAYTTLGGSDGDSSENKKAWPSGADAQVVVIGSRAHLVKSEAVVKRSKLRNFLMYSFHTVLYLLAGPLRAIGDTQCGFKLLSRAAAARIVPDLHVTGWIFDIELLLRAVWLNIPVIEVAVTWHEVGGSKLQVAVDSVKMLLDLLWLRTQYALGLWKVE